MALSILKDCSPIIEAEGREFKNLRQYSIIVSDEDGDGDFCLSYGKEILLINDFKDEKDSFSYHCRSKLMIFEDGHCIWG